MLENFIKKLKTDRKTQIIFIIVLCVLLGVAIFLYYYFSDKDGASNFNLKEKTSLDAGRRLDGVLVPPENANEYPVAVMIENLVTVRPQSGLAEAGVVYEALAEGGITRFMAMYAGEVTNEIGPVRSARPYFVEWVSEYDALYAHCGGSPQALEMISAYDIKTINQIGGDHAYYWRDPIIAAPHNLFTSTELLTFALRDKNLIDEVPTYTPWKFKDEAKLADRPTEDRTINIEFSGPDYAVEYRYDREANSYQRFNGGMEHLDANTGNQLAPKNVIVQKVVETPLDDQGRINLDVVGEGEAIIFTNGKTVEGKWEKDDRVARTIYYDQDGKEIELSRGQTFVEIVPEGKEVTHN